MIELRELTIDHASDAWQLSKDEGWNQSITDWRFMISHPGNICQALFFDSRVIGTAIAMNYNAEVAWIAMVLVHPEFRGRGYSKMILNRIFELLGDRIVIKLDATPAGVPVYEKLGFQNEYRIFRWVAASVSVPALHDPETTVLPVTSHEKETMISFDSEIFGTPRAGLIDYLLREFPGNGWMVQKGHAMEGFCLGREGNHYHHIGPMMANDRCTAEIILSTALNRLHGKPVVVDVPDYQPELFTWLSNYGFKEQRSYIRMFRNKNFLKGNHRNQYLICGAEFG
jgi:GNAT superfamily N-acetyltransferase